MNNLQRWSALLILYIISVVNVPAQSFSGKQPQAKEKVPNLAKVYISPAKLRAQELVNRTKTGFYTALFTAVGKKKVTTESPMLRTQAPCAGNYLCSNSVLPVTLLYFNGDRLDDSSVRLYWETSSETNNSGFEVERSSTGTGNFTKVGYADGAGNSEYTKNYNLTDFNSSMDISYYRLKQIDYDEQYVYSRIIAIAGFKKALIVAAVPNPSLKSDIYLQVEGLNMAEEVDLIITDVKGIVVYRNEHATLSVANRIYFNATTKLTAGLYHAKIASKTEQTTISFVVVD